MKFILGKKIGMMQIFEGDTLKAIPVTVIEAAPNVVTQVKKKDSDGYWAIQVGFGLKKKLNKPMLGHLKGLGNFQYLEEFRVTEQEAQDYKRGEAISVSVFEKNDKVKVSGISKGRGFAGVVKRHGFRGGPKTHGQKHSLRRPGSIGATTPQRVIKGTRMAGQMGNKRVTVKGLRVVEIDSENNLLFIQGAVPGANGSLVQISSQ